MRYATQRRLDEIVEDDLTWRHPRHATARYLNEEGYSSFAPHYLTWRWWDDRRNRINKFRRLKRSLRKFLRVRPVPLILLVILAVIAYSSPTSNELVMTSWEYLLPHFTAKRLLLAGAVILTSLLVVLLGSRITQAWEIRHSNDAALITNSFLADNDYEVFTPGSLYTAMRSGGGSRAARIEYSRNLPALASQVLLYKEDQDHLDFSLRTKPASRYMKKHRAHNPVPDNQQIIR